MDTREQLKLYIKREGVTQKHIAKKIGITSAMLGMYLKGTRNLGKDNLANLEQFLASKYPICG